MKKLLLITALVSGLLTGGLVSATAVVVEDGKQVTLEPTYKAEMEAADIARQMEWEATYVARTIFDFRSPIWSQMPI
jgi:hypothetical protein